MVNRQRGQIKIGRSGPIVIGNQYENTQPPQVKIGSTSIGQQSSIVSKQQLPPQIYVNNCNVNIDDIKNFVTEGYRKILLRDPDPIELQRHTDLISSGGTTNGIFLSDLRNSEEYINELGSWATTNRGIKLIEYNKLSGRQWFFGLQGTWWWEMTEEDVIKKLEDVEKSPKIAIASIVRDEECNGNLGRFLGCCQDLEQYHNNIIYIFVEGDSSDRTYNVLNNWVNTREGSILERMNKGTPHYPKIRSTTRTTILGELRNRLVDLILSVPDIAEILIIDASYGWKGDLISSLRETNADIAAPLAVMHKDRSGHHIYYDIWAFRKNGVEFKSYYPYIAGMVFDRPVDIDSAGGGYLMKRSVLEAGIRYDGRLDCEHVKLCNDARRMGFSVKINPMTYIRKGGMVE